MSEPKPVKVFNKKTLRVEYLMLTDEQKLWLQLHDFDNYSLIL